ncbi:MAG: Uncharacterised protein [Porticoccaceae bacterium UBA1117]|nr:MAG: Uncharacterised protein [Porticoccaceae bacterium UBA1117]|tara:strand:- start:272 stop:823 length:552 start_codon:yes stop_codon:yes gene_type:complete
MATTTLTEGIEAYQTDITFGDGIDVTGTATVSGATTLGSAVNSLFVRHVAHVSGVSINSTAGDSPTIGTFVQPANTIITDIKIFCVTAPVCGSGDIGYEVGTSSSGAQIVATQADEILDAGTTVVVGNVTLTELIVQTQDAATAPASVQYTAAARNIFCNITNTVNATTAGAFTFVIEYVQVA